MAKVFISGGQCDISSFAIDNFVYQLNDMGHIVLRNDNDIKDADYIIFNGCVATGNSFDAICHNVNFLDYFKQKGTNLIIIGCVNNVPPFIDHLKKYFPNLMFASKRDWPIDVLNMINNSNVGRTEFSLCEYNTSDLYIKTGFKSFVITMGCLNDCGFCKVNYMEHDLTSTPVEKVLRYIDKLVAQGVFHIGLKGQNIAQYGIDLDGRPHLHEVLAYMRSIPAIKLISIGDVTIQDMYPELSAEMVINKKLCLTVVQPQIVSDPVLEMMNRHHTVANLEECLEQWRANERMRVLATAMVGHPGTKTEDLKRTMATYSKYELELFEIYIYVNSEMVPSSRYEQLSELEKKRQYQMLKAFQKKNNYQLYLKQREALIGKTAYVVERAKEATRFDLGLNHWGISYPNIVDMPIGTEVEVKGATLVKRSKFTDDLTFRIRH